MALTHALTHIVTHIVTHSLIPLHCQLSHSVTRLLGHPPTWSLTHSLDRNMFIAVVGSLYLAVAHAGYTNHSLTHSLQGCSYSDTYSAGGIDGVCVSTSAGHYLTRSRTHPVTHPITQSFAPSLNHSLNPSLTHSLPHRLLQWHHHLQPVPRQLRHQVLHQQPLLHSLRQWHLQADLCVLRHCVLRLLVSE